MADDGHFHLEKKCSYMGRLGMCNGHVRPIRGKACVCFFLGLGG